MEYLGMHFISYLKTISTYNEIVFKYYGKTNLNASLMLKSMKGAGFAEYQKSICFAFNIFNGFYRTYAKAF